MILIIIDIAVFLGWPILFLSQDTPNVLIVMTASINFIIACSTTLLLFVPKVISHQKHGNDGPALRPMISTGISNETSFEGVATALDRLSTGEGEAILTTKAPRELLDEIYKLQDRVRELTQENDRLLEKIPENEHDPATLGKNGTIPEEAPGIEECDTMETEEGHMTDSC